MTLQLLCKKVLMSFPALGAFLFPALLSGQYAFDGPIPAITSGYGSFGNDSVIHEFFTVNPDSLYECDDTVRGIISYPYGANAALPEIGRAHV